MTDGTTDRPPDDGDLDLGPSAEELFGDIASESPDDESIEESSAAAVERGVEDRTAADVFTELRTQTASEANESGDVDAAILDESPEAIIERADEPAEPVDRIDDDLFDEDAFEALILTDRRKEGEFLWVDTGGTGTDEAADTGVDEASDSSAERTIGEAEGFSDEPAEDADGFGEDADDSAGAVTPTETDSATPTAVDIELGSEPTSERDSERDAGEETAAESTSPFLDSSKVDSTPVEDADGAVDSAVEHVSDETMAASAVTEGEEIEATDSGADDTDADVDPVYFGAADANANDSDANTADGNDSDANTADGNDSGTTAADGNDSGANAADETAGGVAVADDSETEDTALVPVDGANDDATGGVLGWLRSKLGRLF